MRFTKLSFCFKTKIMKILLKRIILAKSKIPFCSVFHAPFSGTIKSSKFEKNFDTP